VTTPRAGDSDPAARGRRVRVVLADRRPGNRTVRRAAEVDEQTPIGRELVRGLVRAQLAAALQVALLAVLLFGPLPALFTLVPVLRTATVLEVPLVWWALGLLAYPVLYLLGRFHRGRAERIERDFAELLERG
jgi:hypothetical protein